MRVFKRGKCYYIDYFYQGRRIKEAVGFNKKAAEDALAIRKAEILQGKYQFKPKRDVLTFGEFSRIYIDQYSKVNKKSYIRDELSVKSLNRWFQNIRLSEITPYLIEKYKMDRSQEVKKATVNRELACLKHIYTMAIKWDKVSANPVKEVKFFKEESKSLRILTKGEERELLKACADHIRPFIIAALYTGMRKSELLGLTWDKVDFDREIIIVEHTKNNEYRMIPMNRKIRNTLMGLKRTGNCVFAKPNGESIKSVKTGFHNALKRAEIKAIRLHDLRHTFASRLVMKGIDLVTVKELLGHKSITMTMRYSHPSPEHKKMAVELLEMDLGCPNYGPIGKLEKREKVVSYS